MRIPHQLLQNGSEKLVGPWLCEQCGKLSQFAVIKTSKNRVFCRNENCGYERLIDKRHARIIEADGTVWAFNASGDKWRVRGQ